MIKEDFKHNGISPSKVCMIKEDFKRKWHFSKQRSQSHKLNNSQQEVQSGLIRQ